ncbi:olfactory receptor 5AP2-like [Rhinophrynus dorsalis]
MELWNNTHASGFVLLGLTDNPTVEIILFVLFFLFYIITVFANIGIIVTIRAETHLHTPMYFFLGNLSFLDLCYSSIITPKALANFISEEKAITYIECALQMYLFGASVTIECFLLGIMAYDRYVAICNPLLYLMVMNKRFCIQLIGFAYIGGYLNATIHTTCTFQLPFCRSNKIDHFYCDVPPLLKLSCNDTMVNELVMFIFGGFAELSSLTTIMVSYIYIITTIFMIHSQQGRKKAFSTCASHLTVVTIFYSTIVFMYLRPSSSYALSQDRVASVFYTVIIPMLNPLIYSFRNKEVARALKILREKLFSKQL